MKTIMAWYFCGSDRKLRYGDGRSIIDGETLTVDCQPMLCQQGLHASVQLRDALSYAPGLVLCRVEVGDYVIGTDKIAGRSRRVAWSICETDIRRIVMDYAKWCAGRAKEHASAAAAAYAASTAAAANAASAAYAAYADYYAAYADYDAAAANAAYAAYAAYADYDAAAANAASAAYAAYADYDAAAAAAAANADYAANAAASAANAAASAANAAASAAKQERDLQNEWLLNAIKPFMKENK